MPNYREGVQTPITFRVYASDGTPYTTTGTPPTLLVQKNRTGAPASATGTLSHAGSGLWSYIPAAGEVSASCSLLHLMWSGSGISPGDVAIEFENDFTPTISGRIDVAVSTRSTITAPDVWANGTRTLTSFGTLVADMATAVWAAATRTLTAISDSSGVSTLLTRLSSARSANLDNLDAAVSSRLASSGYTAPLDAAGTRSAVGLASSNLDGQLSGISNKTANLPADPASNTQINTRLAAGAYVAPDNAGIAAGASAAAVAATAAQAAQARVELGVPNASPGTAIGVARKQDLPPAPDNTGIAAALAAAVSASNSATSADQSAMIAADQAGLANTRVQLALPNSGPGSPTGLPRTQDVPTSALSPSEAQVLEDLGAMITQSNTENPAFKLSALALLLSDNDVQRALGVLGVRGGSRTTGITGVVERMNRPDGDVLVRSESASGSTTTLVVADE